LLEVVGPCFGHACERFNFDGGAHDYAPISSAMNGALIIMPAANAHMTNTSLVMWLTRNMPAKTCATVAQVIPMRIDAITTSMTVSFLLTPRS
jgi:hypothetical protein